MIFGAVQGVGFRPFVFRLANELQIAGSVRNDGFGVEIEAQADFETLRIFKERLIAEKPPLAVIARLEETEIPLKNNAIADEHQADRTELSPQILGQKSIVKDKIFSKMKRLKWFLLLFIFGVFIFSLSEIISYLMNPNSYMLGSEAMIAHGDFRYKSAETFIFFYSALIAISLFAAIILFSRKKTIKNSAIVIANNAKQSAIFTIDETQNSEAITTHLPPDTAICAECLAEMRDFKNRRFRHPFISCTNCGPRYTIARELPYDRAATAMSDFPMCAACLFEYENPLDRRFHAQPIACNECGSRVVLLDANRVERARDFDAIKGAADAILQGKIVAIKALGGFQLCANARNYAALKLLRDRKSRPAKPFAILCADLAAARTIAEISEAEAEFLTAPSRAITLLKKGANYDLSHLVAPEIDRVGIMLPSAPIQFILMEILQSCRNEAGSGAQIDAIVATSANLAESPIARSAAELFAELGGVFDCVLDHDREVINAADDSVLQVAEIQEIGNIETAAKFQPIIIRRARGFAPQAIALPAKLAEPTLAVGAQQKCAIAIGFSDQAVLSPHIGDLFSVSAQEYFERAIAAFKRLYRFEPARVVADAHPQYASTRWALARGLPTARVWHHHAHALAVMAEFQLKAPVLAIAWDGAGYGADGAIWGGEILIANYDNFERVGHLRDFALIGGENAIKNPEKIAAGLLYELQISSPILTENFAKMIANKINSPRTTSMGRLFDAIAYLSGILESYGFDGQSGLMIEKYADPNELDSYHFAVENGVVDYAGIVRGVLRDRKLNVDRAKIAAKFLNTLTEIAAFFAEKYNLPIVLCGGVFQNKTLAIKVISCLTAMKKQVYLSRKLPPNDGAIAIGQLAFLIGR